MLKLSLRKVGRDKTIWELGSLVPTVPWALIRELWLWTELHMPTFWLLYVPIFSGKAPVILCCVVSVAYNSWFAANAMLEIG